MRWVVGPNLSALIHIEAVAWYHLQWPGGCKSDLGARTTWNSKFNVKRPISNVIDTTESDHGAYHYDTGTSKIGSWDARNNVRRALIDNRGWKT